MRARIWLSSGILVLASVATAADNLPLIGSGTGTSFRRLCPSGHVLTGFRFRKGAVVDGIGIRCRPVNTGGSLGAEINAGSMAGGNGGNAGSASCRENAVIAHQRGGGAGFGIADLHFNCHQWLRESRAWGAGFQGALTVRVGIGVPTATEQCALAQEPAIGIHGRHGSIVDAVGLVCGRP